MYDKCVELLKQRGVVLKDLVELVVLLQGKYHPELHQQEAKVLACISGVLDKDETENAVMTAIELDTAAEQDRMSNKQLQQLLLDDASLFGIDEVVAYSICNIYGSIALTNFGYIDKIKPGIIGRLNDDKSHCHCFLDDIVGAIAAAAASKLAHLADPEDEI